MKIKIGSYVKVTKGDLKGGIYKVFDVSQEGNFVAVGVRKATEYIAIENVLEVSEDDFNNANYNELSQEVYFF